MIPQSVVASRVNESSLPEEGDRSSLRIHSPSLRPMTVAEPPTSAGGVKPLACLKYRWVTVVFLGGFLAFVLAFTAWSLIPVKYTTNSLVRVFSDNPVVYSKEDAQGRSDFSIYLKSQAAMIKSHFVLNAALRDPNIAALPMLREQADPVRYLEEELKVESTEGSEILKISLSGDDPQAISKIVNAIQEAYFREVVDEEVRRNNSRLKQLEDAISRLQKDVLTRQSLTKQNNAVNPITEPIPGLSQTLAVNQLLHYKELLGKLDSEIANWDVEKASVAKKLANVADELSPPVGFLDSLDKDPKMMVLARKIELYSSKIDYVIKASGDPNLPSVLEMKKKVADAQEEREQFKRERIADYQKGQQPIVEKKLKDDLERGTSNLVLLANQKKKLEEQIEEYQKQINQSGGVGDIQDFGAVDVRERTIMVTKMLDKANLLRLEVNAPPRVSDFQRAAVPMKRDLKKQILGTIMAGLIGFGIVGFGVIVTESRVRRAMTLADVQNNVIGPIAGILPPRSKGKIQTGVGIEIGETMEKTRTNLLHQFARPGGKVIAVTSSLTEEGKAYLSWQLAESFSQSGSRTLLIDFDLRSPSLHRELNLENERGVCDVLAGKAELGEILQPQPAGLTFLRAGKWSPEVRLGLTAERLEAMLQSLRVQFDVVVMNTHPLLAVAETFMLCRNSDGVLLSVERHESRVPMVARAYEKLASASPEVFGIVYQGATAEECLN